MKLKESKFIALLKKHWPLLAYFLISVIFLFPILLQKGLPFKYDWSWPLFDTKEFWKHLFDASSLGLFSAPGKYAVLTLGLPCLIKIPASIELKFFLLAVHVMSGYGFYLFLLNRIRSKPLAFIAGLAYAFSPYIFIRTIVGFIYSMIAYAVLPWLILVYSKKQKRFWHFLLIGFLLSIIFGQIQAGILAVLLLIANLFVVLILRAGFKKRFLEFIFTLVAFFVVNLPWIIFYLLKSKTVAIPSGGAATTLNFIASLPHSFRNVFMLSDHQITSSFFYTLSHDKMFVLGWLVVWLIAFCSIFNNKNRELVLTFLISLLIVLPFIKGPIGIFGKFYIWFYNHFPQIAVFRETYHFEFLYAISLCVLFAFGLAWIWRKIDNFKLAVSSKQPAVSSRQQAVGSRQKVIANCKLQTAGLLRIAIKALLAGSAIFIIAPYLTFDYAGYFKLQSIPSEYYELNDFFKANKNYCSKIYYPPGTGFLYFRGDSSGAASNSDSLANSLNIPYLTDGTSVLNLPSEEMFYRNELVSEFYESKDNGEFVNLLSEGGIDCVMVRADIESKYFEVSNLWREKDSKIYEKWMNPDMLTLAKNKQGLVLDKRFGENIYIFKPQTSNLKPQTYTSKTQNLTSQSATQQFNNLTIQQLSISNWADQYDYYKDGWSRGRYAFWRKMIFAKLRQDFIYTDKQDSQLSAKIDQRGLYEIWIRLLIGGTAGELEVKIQDTSYKIQKDSGEERFVWKKLADVDITDGKIEITNTAGENAIADIVLISK